MYNFIFTIIKFFQYRSLLKSQEFVVDKIVSLDLNKLKQENIAALILDFDGVLSSEGEISPVPKVIEWLDKAIPLFSKKIFILSNNPLLERKQFFDKYFNNQIEFIVARPKPDPEGIMTIFNNLQLLEHIKKSQILLVDDRLATGILAAKIFGIASCLVKRPYVNLKRRLFEELFFMFIRKIERLLVWHL